MSFRRVMLVSMLCLLLPAVVLAQYRHIHQGVSISLGLGYGTANLSCQQCGDLGREGDITTFLAIGGALAPTLIVGGEANFWTRTDSSNDQVSLGGLAAIAIWYPDAREGFFVKGGVGLSYVNANIAIGGGQFLVVDNTGFAYQIGLGYDLRIQRNLSVSPVVNFYGGDVGSVGSFRGVRFNVLQFMASVTFH